MCSSNMHPLAIVKHLFVTFISQQLLQQWMPASTLSWLGALLHTKKRTYMQH